MKKPKIREIENKNHKLEDSLKEERRVFLNGEEFSLPVYDRNILPIDEQIKGGAILEDPTSTVIVLESQKFIRDRYGNIIIQRGR